MDRIKVVPWQMWPYEEDCRTKIRKSDLFAEVPVREKTRRMAEGTKMEARYSRHLCKLPDSRCPSNFLDFRQIEGFHCTILATKVLQQSLR